MDQRPRPGKEAQAQGGFPGVQEGGKSLRCGSQHGGGVYQGGGRWVGQTWRGPVLAGSRAERLDPFSYVLKEAGRGRKNKPRHTLGGCRLARALGTTSPVPGCRAQPARSRRTHPSLGKFRSDLQWFLGLWGVDFYRGWDNSVLFQRDGQPGPEGWFSTVFCV